MGDVSLYNDDREDLIPNSSPSILVYKAFHVSQESNFIVFDKYNLANNFWRHKLDNVKFVTK